MKEVYNQADMLKYVYHVISKMAFDDIKNHKWLMVDDDKWCVRDAYKNAHMMYRVVLHEYQLVMRIQTI